MAVGVRSSSSMWSSLRSISSRRRRISERRSSEVMTLIEERGPGRRGAYPAGGFSWQSRSKLGLFTLRWWEKCAVSFASSTSPSGRYRLVALTRSRDLFVCARNLLIEAMAAFFDMAATVQGTFSISAGSSHLPRRLSCPALVCMRECAHVTKAEQPRNLGYVQLGIIEVTNR